MSFYWHSYLFSAGVVTTAAGSGFPTYLDGLASVAGFESPLADAVDTFGNVFVAEFSQFRIRKISSAGL